MRQVLLFITDLEIGGTPTVVRELATRLMPFASIEVASLKTAGPVGEELRARGVKVHSLGARRVTDLGRSIRKLSDLIRSEKFDTLLSFLIHANFVASRVCAMMPTLRCLQSIQTTQTKPRWHWWLQSRIHRAAARIIVPSESVANRAIERSGVPVAKIVVIPNAVDAKRFAGPERIPGDKGIFRVGFVGRLDPVKCIPDLVLAMTYLPQNVRLGLFGEGPMRAELEALIARAGLQKRVKLHGATNDPPQAYSQMDMLVLPSRAEGFGLVLIEAMAARVPVVGTDVDGIRDVVSNEQNGLLVPCGKPRAIAAAVSRIMNEPALRNGLVARAQHEVESRFAWPAVIDQYRDVLNLR